MRVLAVDFGTSNTVAALGIDGGAPRLVTIDGSPLVPSSVFLTDDGVLAVGRDADRQARIDPSRYEPNPKRRIDDGFILLGSQAMPVTRVIAEVLRRVGAEVQRQLGRRPDQVRLTHPARWGQRRKDTLIAAAREAGLADEPILVPEPVAAATHFATLSGSGLAAAQALAVYDLGGGTFDIAVVQRRGDGYEVLAEAGLPDLGGLDFDHSIVEHIGRTHVQDTSRGEWERLLMPTDAASRRMARALSTDVRDGKEALSRYPHVDIALPPPFTDVHLTRAEFEDLIRPNLSRSIDLMRRTVSEAGYQPARLAGVYLVGGSSRIPLVARLIQEGLGVTPTTLDQPETSVATGALYLGVGQASPAAQGPLAASTGQVPAVAPTTTSGPIPTVPQRFTGPIGPPSGPQPVVGSPSGNQPVVRRVPAPNLPPPVSAAPWARPDTVPRGAPPAKPSSRGSGRLFAIGGGVLAAVLATVLVVVLATRGGNAGAGASDDPTTTESSDVPTDDPTDPPTGGGSFDQFFADADLRGYVRPVYGEMETCSEGLASEVFEGAVTCKFTNGVEVSLGTANSSFPLTQMRTLMASGFQVGAGLAEQEQGQWSRGKKDFYTKSADSDTPAGIYWDRTDGEIWAIAEGPSDMDKDALNKWWEDTFQR